MATINKEEKVVEEKMVKIKLFKDSDKYSSDVFVSRNGENYLIQRGVEVEVPEGIAKILKNSEEMDQLAATRKAAAQARNKAAN